MNNMNAYLVVTVKSWNIENFKRLKDEDLGHAWHLMTAKEDLTRENVDRIKPRYIFFPHWSWIIQKDIFEAYECVVFHMTDLPYGRGGSPLQNLIARGHTETKVSAIRVVKGLDAGDMYLKKDLSLHGSAEEIFRRASDISYAMMREIVRTEPKPKPQVGEAMEFKRRKPEDGNLAAVDDIHAAYDAIRMLDAEGYPRSYLETEHLRMEFDRAALADGEVNARVTIKKK